MDDYITTKEAAQIVKLTVKQVGWLLRRGKLEGKKFGRDWAVSRMSAEAYAQQWHKPGPKPKEPEEGASNA